MREIVLNAEQKSTDNILMQVLLFSRCVRAEGRAVETLSSDPLLILK